MEYLENGDMDLTIDDFADVEDIEFTESMYSVDFEQSILDKINLADIVDLCYANQDMIDNVGVVGDYKKGNIGDVVAYDQCFFHANTVDEFNFHVYSGNDDLDDSYRCVECDTFGNAFNFLEDVFGLTHSEAVEVLGVFCDDISEVLFSEKQMEVFYFLGMMYEPSFEEEATRKLEI